MKVTCLYNSPPAAAGIVDVNPCLRVEEIPEGAQSLVVTAQNQYTGKFHWIVYNIPVSETIDEDFRKGVEAVNDFDQHKFKSPDPHAPDSVLLFTVYALSDVLHIGGGKGGHDIRRALYRFLLDVAEVEYFADPLASVAHGYSSFDMYDIPPGMHD